MFEKYKREGVKRGFTQEEKDYLHTLSEEELVPLLARISEERVWDEEMMREYLLLVPFGSFATWQSMSEDFVREFLNKKWEMHVVLGGLYNTFSPKFRRELNNKFKFYYE